ncbi:ABC transporter permease [Ohtaekwangia kribbensis]|uniref:ABC transporter permease n=1 Tax=Ohtaekwangia kribbensis TaxID=688913 RepID=A0ABW3K0G5_9BACT
MIRNYLKIAIRNLTRNIGYSIINIGGLAVGMSVAMFIGLWVYDELTYNRYQSQYSRVAQVMQSQTFNNHVYTQYAIPYPLGIELEKSYGSDFKYIVMSSWTGDHILSHEDHSISSVGNYMDVEAPRLMDLKMIKGSPDGLRDPASILLSQSAAKAVFGDQDPINKMMKIDNSLDVKVTGIYEDIPHNSDWNEIMFIAPWKLYSTAENWVKNAENEWDNNSFQLFVQIADRADMKTVSDKIIKAKYNRVPDSEKIFNAETFLHPMDNWHLKSNWENGAQTGGLIEYVWLFGCIGIFVLLLACINFMNLSTARSEQRAKEVGIRKSIGSVRKQLVTQFLSESLMVVILAFCLTIIIVSVSLPMFNNLADKKISLPLGNAMFWLISIAFILITGFLSGSYPALYLSSFQPVKVLKGTFRAGRYASLPRKVLVVVQFTVSITLIIGTLVVYRQVQFTKDRPVGYDRSGIIMIQKKSPDFLGKFDVLRNELKNKRIVEEMAESSSPLTGVWSNSGGFDWEGKDPELQTNFSVIRVTREYGKTIDWQVKEGRDFSREFSTDSSSIIVNEAAVKFMGIDDPIGKTVRWGSTREYKIIGIVKDMLMESPFEPVNQAIYFNEEKYTNWIVLRLNPDRSLHESLAGVEQVFKKYLPLVPFDYKFVDVEHANKFADVERIGALSGIFAVLAIFISCLGLLGLASFVAEQRTKEIGIRKVLGASVASLWRMLSKDFVILVSISCLMAVPLSYYFTADWIDNYQYRADIAWWIFGAACVGALVITLLMVSFHAIRAALVNPVQSLRAE